MMVQFASFDAPQTDADQWAKAQRMASMLEQMQANQPAQPSRSVAEAAVRGVGTGIQAFLGGRVADANEARKQQQATSIADLLAPAGSGGPDPRREQMISLLSSGAVSPSAFGGAVASKLGFGEAADPIIHEIYDEKTGQNSYAISRDNGQTWEPFGGTKTDVISPAAEEQKARIAEAGASKITVGGGKYGTIPPGYELVDGPEGASMRPIPGGPAALEAEAAGQKAQAAEQQADVATATAAEKANIVLNSVADIRAEMEGADAPVTGTFSRPFATLSNTAAGRVRSYVGALKSAVALGAMARLKEASATGATGFGALNQSELQLLIDEVGSLNPDNTEPDIFLKSLDNIERRYQKVIDDIRRNVDPARIDELGLAPLLSAGSGAPAAPAAPPSTAMPTATNPQTGEKLMFDGQSWVPANGG